MRLTLRTMLAYLDDILDADDSKELGKKIEESKFASELVHRIRNSTRRLRLGAPKPEGKGMGLDPNTVAEYLDNTLAPEHVPDFEKVCLESDVHLAEVASCHQILTLVLGEPAAVEHAIRQRIYGVGSRESQVQPSTEEPLPHLASLLVQEAMPVDGAPTPAEVAPASGRFTAKSFAITAVLAILLAVVGLRAMGEFGANHPLWRLVSPAAEEVAHVPEDLPAADTSSETEPTENESTTTTMATASEEEADPRDVEVPEVTPLIPAEETVAAEEVTPDVVPAAAEIPLESSVASGGGPSETREVNWGRLLSEDQVLVRFDQTEEVWLGVLPDSLLATGDALVVLPSYRPQIVAAGGMSIRFAGTSQLRLAEATEWGPQMSIDFGRFLVESATDKGSSLHLDLGERKLSIGLLDMESVAAVEVSHFLAPGADPETARAQLVVRVYCLRGRVTWQELDTEPVLMADGQFVTALAAEPPVLHSLGSVPAWITGADQKEIDLRAARRLREHIAPDRPLIVSLMEQTEPASQRQVEVRALANRGLVLLGVYDAILQTLEDKRQRSYWGEHFEMLRFAVAQGSEPAAKLQRIVDVAYGADSGTVFRLLRGYSPEQLAAGAAEELVHLLSHPKMGVRVLALLNLKAITGRTHYFLPSKDPGQSRQTLLAWRRSLDEGRVVYDVPPSPLPEVIPAASASPLPADRR